MSRPQSERRNSYRTSAKGTTRRMVGLCDGMLSLLAQRARQDKTAFEKARHLTDHQSPLEHGLSTFQLPRKTGPAWTENPERNVLGLCATCGERLVRRLDDSRRSRFANSKAKKYS